MLADREQVRRNVEDGRSPDRAARRRVGRDPGDVSLIAVTKTVDVERIRWAVEAGVLAFGENYVQELRRKQEELAGVSWHFIGTLQSSTAHRVADHADVVRDGRRGAGGPAPRRSRGSVRTHDRRVDRGRPDGRSRRGSPRRARRVRRSRRLARGTAADRPHDDAPDPARSGRLPPALRAAPRSCGKRSRNGIPMCWNRRWGCRWITRSRWKKALRWSASGPRCSGPEQPSRDRGTSQRTRTRPRNEEESA